MSVETKIDSRERVLSAVTMRGVLQTFCPNTKIDRQGRCACPIHGGKKNSFKVYDDTNTFYCFACGSAGDAIKFVSLLFDISYGQAIREIATAFGIPIGNDITKEEQAHISKVRKITNLIIELDKKEQKKIAPLIEKKGELVVEIITIQGVLQDKRFESVAYEEYAQLKSILDYCIYQMECVEDEIATIKSRNETIKRRIRNEGISECHKNKKSGKNAKSYC